MTSVTRHAHFVRMSGREQMQQKTSLDDLVGEREQARRDGNTGRSRRWEVDDQLETCRLSNRHVGRFLALEDTARIDADLAISD
jgi:hypothetical protein